jgi:putative ABC transport system ATP-binding protein
MLRLGSSAVPPGDGPVIRLKDVTRTYVSGDTAVHALRSVSLDVHPGEFVAIIGTSGSGKSTMMNILGGLDRPTSGTYELAGTEIGHRSASARALARNRLIGFVFQGYNLLPRLTALENTELPLQYRKVTRAERRRRATSALQQVGLAHRLDHRPNEMSGGQQQRVAIARALVTDPPLLLADEPTGNLDTRTTFEVLAMLQKLNRERALTIVLVTHENEVAACAGRVITVRDGAIISDVRNERPTDAAHELSRIPAPPQSAVGERGATSLGALSYAAYVWVVVGTALGAGLGYLYSSWMFERFALAGAAAGALLGEPLAVTIYAARARQAIGPAARWRLALLPTALAIVGVVGTILFAPDRVSDFVAAIQNAPSRLKVVPAAFALVLASVMTITLARFALLKLLHNHMNRFRVLLGVVLTLSFVLFASSAFMAVSSWRARAAVTKH